MKILEKLIRKEWLSCQRVFLLHDIAKSKIHSLELIWYSDSSTNEFPSKILIPGEWGAANRNEIWEK